MTGDDGTAAPLFFVHVMRTGGSTFRALLQQHYGSTHVYPDPGTDLDLGVTAESSQNPHGHPIEVQAVLDSYISVEQLRRVSSERQADVRAYVGHFPFVVTELLGIDLVTITLLRDPVERTISRLRTSKARRPKFAECSLEEIYEDGFEYPFFIHNHQAKVFAMEPGDRLESVMDVVDIDERRLAVAKANLEKVDVLGLQERYPAFLTEVGRRFGWDVGSPTDWNVSVGDEEISSAFRRRIAEDNAADIELYRHACRLVDQR